MKKSERNICYTIEIKKTIRCIVFFILLIIMILMKYRFILLSSLLFFALGIGALASDSTAILSSVSSDPRFLSLLFFCAAAAILPAFNVGGGQNGS